MGQAESYPKTDKLLKEKLILQYSGVDIDSIHSAEHKTRDKSEHPDSNSILDNNNKNQLADNSEHSYHNNNDGLLGQKLEVQQQVVDRKYSGDLESSNVSRKSSKDFDALRETHSSSEKIFEEYADYANELINAPYHLTTKYTSLETVTSKESLDVNGLDTGILSVLNEIDQLNGSSTNHANEDTGNNVCKENDFGVGDSPEVTYSNVPVLPRDNSVPNKDFSDINQQRATSRLQILKKKFEEEEISKESTNDKETTHHPPGKLNPCLLHYLEQETKFHLERQQKLQKQQEEGNHSEYYENVWNKNVHEPLSRKKAVIVNLKGDSHPKQTTPLSERLSVNSLSGHCTSKTESVYTNFDVGGQSDIVPPSTTALPNVSEQNNNAIKKYPPDIVYENSSTCFSKPLPSLVVNSDKYNALSNVSDLKVHVNGCVVNQDSETNSVSQQCEAKVEVVKNSKDILRNKPRVASLRKKFEDIILDKVRLNNLHKLDKYPIVKSKSDTHIKFAEQTDVIDSNLKEESDGLYEEYTVRTSFRKTNQNSRQNNCSPLTVKRTNQNPGQNNYSPLTVKRTNQNPGQNNCSPLTVKRTNQNAVKKNFSPASVKKKQTLEISEVQNSISVNHFAHNRQNHKLTERRCNSRSSSPQTRTSPGIKLRNRNIFKKKELSENTNYCIQKVADSQEKFKEPRFISHKKDTDTEMDFHRSKKESKRHRRKSDSSTSNLSDSSTPISKSSKKWKKSKDKKDMSKKKYTEQQVNRENEDTGLSQQWGSMITEYQEKYVSNDKARQKSSRGNQNMNQYNNVRQVFNKGMVLPVKRAPPGLSAQEVESDSGVTDYSTHSWTAMNNHHHFPYHHHHHPGIKAHIDGVEYMDNGQTFVKQKLDEPFFPPPAQQYPSQRVDPATRMRFSSQSSQYTSDAPMSPGHQRRRVLNDYNGYVSDGYRGGSRHVFNNYTERPVTPERHQMSRVTQRHNDYLSSPEVPRRVRLVKQTVSYSSDGATSPKIVRKFRAKSLPREPFDNGYIREKSLSRERLEHGRQHEFNNGSRGQDYHFEYADNSLRRGPSHQSRARSLSRDRLNRVGLQRNMQKRSMSSDRLDYYQPYHPVLESDMRERNLSGEAFSGFDREDTHYQYRKKTSKKKTIDEKAKRFVDNVIDEAIDRFTLSPKSKRKSKSKENLNSTTTRKNVVNTTNIYNEYIEDEGPVYNEDRMVEKRTFSDHEDHRMNYNNRRTQNYDNLERDLKVWNNQHLAKRSLLRPQPIDNALPTEKRSCLRPVAGSGITRHGNAPPPKSAYKNYDFELSVGPSQYGSEGKKKERRSHQQSSGSEYSAVVNSRRHAHQTSQYPHITFGPLKSKSEENLLSESRKSTHVSPPKRVVKVKSTDNLQTSYQDDNDYETEARENGFNPPTLTKGMVTKIIHKLDEDVHKLASLRDKKAKASKRSQLDMSIVQENDNYVTNTWPRHENTDRVERTEVSTIGAALYSTLPNDRPEKEKEHQPSSYTTYLPSLHASENSTSNISPQSYTEKTLSSSQHHEELARNQKHQEVPVNVDHARFTTYHGQHLKIQPKNDKHMFLNVEDQGRSFAVYDQEPLEQKKASTYGAFSNEQMIIADLTDDKFEKSMEPKSLRENYKVKKVGQLFGTQPDVSMNKQQTLNLFLFNQSKSGDETEKADSPQMTYMARNVEYSNNGKKKQQTDLYVNEEALSDSDVELRQYLIHHKQTQTPNVAPEKPKSRSKKKKDKQYIIVQQSPPPRPSKKHIETTHYITQEREIERVPPQRQMREMCIQTDEKEPVQIQYLQQPQYTVETMAVPEKQEHLLRQNVVEQSSFISRPIITQSRHMEKHNYEPPSPTPSSPAVSEKTIPIMVQPSFSEQYMEKLENEYYDQHDIVPVEVSGNMELAVKSDDDETVILETTEVEEKEQRIAMAIFEEVEFSAKRTEGGKTVNVVEGSSEIPAFWEPDKFEAVVDRKKKKMTQVKETNQEHEGKRTKHPSMFLPAIEAADLPNTKPGNFKKPMAIQEEKKVNTPAKKEIAEEITEKIAALDKVLEDELAKDNKGAEEPNVVKKNVKSDTKLNEEGVPVTQDYINYEKIVNMQNNNSIPVLKQPSSYQVFHHNLSPQSQRKVKTTHSINGPTEYKETWKSGYVSPQRSPTLSQRIKKVKSSYQHTPLEPMFMTERGSMYGRSDKINHHPGVSIKSSVDPNNVSFVNKTETYINEMKPQESLYNHHVKTNPPTPPPLPSSALNGPTIHSEQSEPVQETHYEKDSDGNLVKVTNWQHKLTKTVEYPEEEQERRFAGKQDSKSFKELPEAGYIKMNLHETVSSSGKVSENETETTEESESTYRVQPKVSEVTAETEVGVKPFHYESKQNTVKVDDDPEISRERQFLYDIRKAKLKPVPKAYRTGWSRKHTYGTMSTHL